MSEIINANYEYRPARALLLAYASEVVYQPPAEIEAAARTHWGCSEFLFFDVQSTQCAVSANYDELIVCFRGSEARLEDWVLDLDFSLVSGPLGGKVHEGFWEGLSLIWSALDEQVRRLLAERPRKVWVTGHSLGGALANLAGAMWAEAGVDVSGVYTFGQPRTGDHDYGRRFDFALRNRAFRIVNDLDIVTRTPPRSMGYSHSSTLIYLTENGDAEHDMTWWQRFLNNWGGAIENIFEWCDQGVEDHRMTRYRSKLERLLANEPPEPAPPPRTIPMHRAATASFTDLVRPRRRAA